MSSRPMGARRAGKQARRGTAKVRRVAAKDFSGAGRFQSSGAKKKDEDVFEWAGHVVTQSNWFQGNKYFRGKKKRKGKANFS